MKLRDIILEGKNTWLPIPPSELSKYKDELFDLIDTAYKPIGGHPNVTSPDSIPNDPRGVWDTSGIRIGTAAMTTIKGPSVKYFTYIANQIADVIKGK